MNQLIQLKQTTSVFLVALTCFGLPLTVQAVSPSPDGCYNQYTTAEGCNALNSLTSGLANTGAGWYSLFSDTTGNYNTGVGAGALALNDADSNTAVGAAALFVNTTGAQNVALGSGALLYNNIGSNNTAIGYQALISNTGQNQNTAIGSRALLNTTGGVNTAVGAEALANNNTGGSNIALGGFAGYNVTTASNVICIGTDGNNIDNSCYIGNIFNATSSGGATVFVNTNGRLGTSTSSKRFKEDIKPINHASETLFALKPVTFRYKKGIDPESPEYKSEFGLVAEDVEKINPDLVVRDKEGKPYSVRYDQVNAMLLNEFLKEHRKVEQLEKQVEALTAGLQKVSAQLELSKAAPQTVLNDQ